MRLVKADITTRELCREEKIDRSKETQRRRIRKKRANSHSLEEAEQIVVLAVDVAAHFDGGFQLQQDGLGHKHVPRVDAQVFDFVLRQLHLFFTGQ